MIASALPVCTFCIFCSSMTFKWVWLTAASAHEAICDLKTMMAIMKSAKSGTWEAVQNVEPDVSMDTLGLDCDACM